jgi:hypothetical protein
LTKKSTEAHVKDLHKAGKIVHYERDLWPDDTCLRRLWMHPNVDNWVNSTGASASERRYFAQVRAFFASFVSGADFDDDDMLKTLSQGKDGLWEFRVTFQPQARVVGGFLRPGEFIALSFADRSALAAAGFGPLIKVVKDRWKLMFPTHAPLMMARADLLTEFDDGV